MHAALLTGVAALGCNEATGLGTPCKETDGVSICIDRSQYRPSWTVRMTLKNNGSETVYQDVCSPSLVRSLGTIADLDAVRGVYDPRRYCGADVTLEDIVAQMRELPPGGSLTVNVQIPVAAVQGFYRVDIWFLDAEGTNLPESPYGTQPFDVFPTAD
jgi:hypothetical protein